MQAKTKAGFIKGAEFTFYTAVKKILHGFFTYARTTVFYIKVILFVKSNNNATVAVTEFNSIG